MNDVTKAFYEEVKHKEQKKVPFVIWSKGPFIPWFSGMKVGEYYKKPGKALEAQTKLHNAYPNSLFWPGIWPDLGPIVDASVFGGKIIYFEDQAPYIMPAFKDVEEYSGLKITDPRRMGIMPDFLRGWEYLWNNINPTYIEQYGYLDGCASIFGPIEVACQVVGYDKLFTALYDKPNVVKSFLDLISDVLIKNIQAQEEINGKIKRLSITDHVAGQISAKHFEEFYLPYIKKVCSAFPEAIKLYHNESRIYHILDRIPELGAQIFHFGIDIADAKQAIGSKICLMGAVHSQEFLMYKSPEEVYEESRRQIRIGAPGGGYLFSVRGGFQPGNSKENIDAMAKAAEDEVIQN